MSKHGRVLVAMSGGIDSTVAAMLLMDEGYDVVGITMKTWDYSSSGGNRKETGCCSLDSINDARQVAVDYGFPHYIIDIRDEFGDYVIDNFVDEYIAGRTPNPCILCNTHIKWEALLRRADMLDCDAIATGHYARLNNDGGRYYVSRAIDQHKDQSYVLWGLSQECMARTLFPLQHLTKTEIRQIAADRGYHTLVNKAESYEICFVPDNDYRGFLKRRVPELESEVSGGQFVNRLGETLGTHEGYPFYTIGQRRGLGRAFGQPMYVTGIVPESNTVVLGTEDELNRREMRVYKTNWMKYERPIDHTDYHTKIRYKDSGAMAEIELHDDEVQVTFHHLVKGIAPGQSAVFYEGDDVIGGGVIKSSEDWSMPQSIQDT